LIFSMSCESPWDSPDLIINAYWGIFGPGNAVGIATRYGLDGPGIEFQWMARISALVQTGPGAHPTSYTMGTGSFPGEKRPRRGVNHPPPSGTEVEGRIKLYFCSPLGLCCLL